MTLSFADVDYFMRQFNTKGRKIQVFRKIMLILADTRVKKSKKDLIYFVMYVIITKDFESSSLREVFRIG